MAATAQSVIAVIGSISPRTRNEVRAAPIDY